MQSFFSVHHLISQSQVGMLQRDGFQQLQYAQLRQVVHSRLLPYEPSFSKSDLLFTYYSERLVTRQSFLWRITSRFAACRILPVSLLSVFCITALECGICSRILKHENVPFRHGFDKHVSGWLTCPLCVILQSLKPMKEDPLQPAGGRKERNHCE